MNSKAERVLGCAAVVLIVVMFWVGILGLGFAVGRLL